LLSSKRRSVVTLLLLIILSVLGNRYGISLFLGVKLLFGNIAVLLIIYLFSVRTGVIVAFFSLSLSFLADVTWIEQYGLLIFTLEALFIGLMWKRYEGNLLVLEGMFWLCLGLPVIFVLYNVFTPSGIMETKLVLLKSPVNGVINALIASLLITHFSFKKWVDHALPKSRASLSLILSNLTVAFMLSVTLITAVISDHEIEERMQREMQEDLNNSSKNIMGRLRSFYHNQRQIVKNLAEVAIQNELKKTTNLDQFVSATKPLLPDFLEITFTDIQGNIQFDYRKKDIQKIFNQAMFKKKSQALFNTSSVLSNNHTFNNYGQTIAVMMHALALKRDGKIIGAIFAHFNLSDDSAIMQELYALTHQVDFILLDDKNRAIGGTRFSSRERSRKIYNTITSNKGEKDNHINYLKLLNFYDRMPRDAKKFREQKIYHWFSKEYMVDSIKKWRNSVYVKHEAIGDNIPIKVVAEMPWQPYIDSLQDVHFIKLNVISIISLLSLLLAMAISHWLLKPLLRLTQITSNLPSRLEQRKNVVFPKSQVNEINTLTENFKIMSNSLQGRFDEINSAKALLEHRVTERTKELGRERALLRSLIDSIPDLIFYKDNQSVYLGCNKAFEKFANHPESEIIGKTDFDLFPKAAKQCREQDSKILATGKPRAAEEWVVYPDGQRKLLDTKTTPFSISSGNLLGVIGISRDITARKEVEEVLRQSQQMLRLVIDNIPQFIFWKDQNQVYLGCNKNFARMTGIHSNEFIIGKTDDELMKHPNANFVFFEAIKQYVIVNEEVEYHRIEPLGKLDGSTLWFDINKIPLWDSDGDFIGVLASFEDITERKQSEEKLRQAAKVLENSTDGICITDIYNKIIVINDSFTKITGFTEAEVLGQDAEIFKSSEESDEFYEQIWSTVLELGYWEGEMWNCRKDGQSYLEWLHLSVIKDEVDDEITHFLYVFSDITERKENEQRLAYMAHYDNLTGLPNRTLFYERVSQAIVRAEQSNCLVSVLFLDLDGFKHINDTWGHAIGDLLLKEVASRMKKCVEKQDTIARLGGDEFTAVLEQRRSVREVAQVAQKMLNVMAPLFHLNGHETFMTTSIGISLYPNDSRDIESLLKNADVAMYRAKENGKNDYQFFTEQVDMDEHEHLTIEVELRHALERNEFVLYYQPQLDLKTDKIIGAEVLLRWQHPKIGVVSPEFFVPLAEETGIITSVGKWVLRQACLQHKRWLEKTQFSIRMAVNLSSRQFKQHDFTDDVAKILRDTNMNPTFLELELNESMLMEDAKNATKILKNMKEMGMLLAIDDFGMGYSSLNYLKRFPIDKLKIDKTFVGNIQGGSDDMMITKAIIKLAQNLDLKVIAEGVETESQLEFLKSLNCDEVQGYLIGRPLPSEEFDKFIGN